MTSNNTEAATTKKKLNLLDGQKMEREKPLTQTKDQLSGQVHLMEVQNASKQDIDSSILIRQMEKDGTSSAVINNNKGHKLSHQSLSSGRDTLSEKGDGTFKATLKSNDSLRS